MSAEHGGHSIRSAAQFMGSIMAAAAGSEIKVQNIKHALLLYLYFNNAYYALLK